MQNKKLKKGEVIEYHRGKTSVIKWRDKKNISLISTIHTMSMVEVELRQRRIEKPQVVVDYNHTTGGR